MSNDTWGYIGQALAGGAKGYVDQHAANKKHELEQAKLREMVNAALMKETEGGFARDASGKVSVDPSFYTEGTPSWLRSNREAELKRSATASKTGGDILTLEQLVEAEKARNSGTVPENMKNVRISPSYNFRAASRPTSGVTAQALRAQGHQVDAGIPDDYVFPTGALPYLSPNQSPTAQRGEMIKNKNQVDAAAAAQRERDRQTRERIAAESLAARKNAGANLTPAQKAVDDKFGKTYADYQVGGGRSKTEAELRGLKEIPDELDKREYGVLDRVIGVLPKGGRDILDPKLSALEDKLKKSIQGSIGQILDSQYAAREADQVFERSWNPRLSPRENSNRIRAEIKRIEEMAADKDAAAEYYETNGTLVGFKPRNASQKRAAGKRSGSHAPDSYFQDDKKSGAKTVTKKQYSQSRNKTRIIYSDGSEEIVDGKK